MSFNDQINLFMNFSNHLALEFYFSSFGNGNDINSPIEIILLFF